MTKANPPKGAQSATATATAKAATPAPATSAYTALGRLYVDGQTVNPGATALLTDQQAQALAGFVRAAPEAPAPQPLNPETPAE